MSALLVNKNYAVIMRISLQNITRLQFLIINCMLKVKICTRYALRRSGLASLLVA